MNDIEKQNIINHIDIIIEKVNAKATELKLKQMRNRYIYKDISNQELKKDSEYLKQLFVFHN
jgi:hypothetical protein